ncbi:MAG TPA: polysaccharide biosynthesis tyrosine autokinase, partial [Phycisphaerae bacterium]|nr:polysaccharide biosynthesis tyrosine autokinase [Phycisphaerae bacterium]
LQKRRGTLDIQLVQLTQELLRLQMFKAQADAGLAALAEQEADGSIAASPEVLRALEMDPVLNMLRNTGLQLQLQRENELQKFGTEHRSVQATETRLTAVRAELADREKMLTQRAMDLIRSDRRATAASITAQMLDVQQRFDEVNARLRDLEQNLRRIEQLAVEEDSLDQRIRRFENQWVDLRLLAQREKQVELWIPATKPREIEMPKWTIMIPVGTILGIALGLGLAFLLEFIDVSIKSPSDISRRVDLPLLGMIPHTDDIDDKIEDMRLAFVTHPNSLVSEAFRQIRTCLLFSGPSSQRRSLLVTSPLPEDGRTTVALNLAGSIAHGGRKVLVVDANFRQPAIRKLFPQCPDGGLSNALVGQANWKDMVYEVQPNLQVMPAGVLPPNPAELLGSDEMRRLVAEMSEQYDEVIIDGAPCLVVTDSAVLSTLVDGVVLTVRAGANTYGVVQRARDILFRVGAHIVGVAHNGVRATSGGYLRKNYETFYEYHDQAQLPAK